MATLPLTFIIVRLLPNPTASATDFTGYLNNLVITAYDQTVIPIDTINNPNAPGTAEYELGVASGPLWQAPPIPIPTPPLVQTPMVNLNPPSGPNQLPTLDATIFQHVEYISTATTPFPLAVATAVIPVNIPGLNTTAPLPRSPYPQYPSDTSYDVRLSMVRNNITLPDPPIQWNVQATTISYPATGFTKPIPFRLSDIIGTTSMYVLLPSPPPTNAPASSTINLSTDGTPPKFDDLVQAINPVLAKFNLAGATSLTSLTVPLTKNQCQTIAQKIAWNPSLTHFPNPIPPFPPPPAGLFFFEQLYTSPSSDGDNYRKQFEGALASYQATNNSVAQKLAPFIFAASAAVYAEVQTIKATIAGWTLPLFTGTGTVTVTLSGSNSPLSPSFVVPAAYFYALCYDYPGSSDAPHRYQAVLTTTADSLYKKIQAAEAIGILGNTAVPVTLSGTAATPVNDVSAVLRLTSLSATYTPGSDPVLSLTGSVATLVSGWLGNPPSKITDQSPYWTSAVFADQDYLNVILQIVSQGPGTMVPPQDTSLFVKAILTTALVPTNPISVVSKAADLPLITQAGWLTLFTQLFATSPSVVPAFLGPGSVQQQTQAFITWIKTLFSVKFEKATGATAKTGNVGSLGAGFSSNVLAQFFSAYSGLNFANPLDETQISNILNTPAFSDPSLQSWIKNAVTTISALYEMTAIPGTPAIDPPLQFSYMEALYSRGFTGQESVALLSQTQFQSALTGTVAYFAAGAIYTRATTPPVSLPPTPPGPGTGFQPCNPGSLVNCIPPPNLSPFSRIEYLHELLLLSSGTEKLSDAVSARRGQLGALEASLANLETKVCVVDLVNESLEALGSNLTVTQGSVYNTADTSLAGFDLGSGPNSFPADQILTAIPQYSSPSNPLAQPAVYSALDVCFTSPILPYSQALDVCRSYLCHIGTSRFDTMRSFRRYVTEFPLGQAQEPADFEKERWRLPVRLDVALEYLQVSNDEYKTLWSATITTSLILQLYGVDSSKGNATIVSLLTVSGYLVATGLTYCQFLDLWKSGVVAFSPQSVATVTESVSQGDSSEYPECPPCCLGSLGINFSANADESASLAKLVIFIRLWRKLQLRCAKAISMQVLADICAVLGLFTTGQPIGINPDFIRQLASLLMLVDFFNLPWTDGTVNSTSTGVERTKLLGIWAGPTANPTSWAWANKALLSSIENYSRRSYVCPTRGPKFAKILFKNLDQLSLLAGFTTVNTWHSTPTCTIRFAEILSKIYCSSFTVGELMFLFTTNDHLDGDDPFVIEDHSESMDNPLDLPDDSSHGLKALRKKLLCVDICDEDIQKWDWYRVESTIRELSFGAPTGKATNDPLLYLAQHFFPDMLEHHGYHVEADKRRFSTNLSPSSTSPSMWGSPPCDPFHYTYDPTTQNSQDQGSGQLWTQIPLRDGDVIKKLQAVRQLNASEILAVQNLYFAPRVALAPFALIFSNFDHAVDYLVAEVSESARFEFFKKEFATFHRRCELIADHLADHVGLATSCKNEDSGSPGQEVAWKILTSLFADENTAATPWETDSGLPPTQFTSDPHFSGSALAALLGLVGTGLMGEYKTGSIVEWLEMRGGMSAFGDSDNQWNTPVPTIIPALNLLPKSNEDDITIKNGMILRDNDGRELGGAQPFTVTWSGSLVIEEAGSYRFGGGHRTSEKEMPEFCPENTWTVTLGRGQKTWLLLDGQRGADPAHISSPVHLQIGVYDLQIDFEQGIQTESSDSKTENTHHVHTGFQLKYEGPDTGGCPAEVPLCSLLRDSKSGPFRVQSPNEDKKINSVQLALGGTASEFLGLQYVSTIRDIRRTYQRAFKATLFAHRFGLSARKMYGDHESELSYLLQASDKFAGTSYYVPAGGSAFQTHHANFDFNFLPVSDPYLPPNATVDSRAAPSPQRQAAIFDWFERIFDYTQLRKQVEKVRKRPIWLLLHDVATQKPSTLDQYVRYIGIDMNLSAMVLQYFATPLYTLVPTDLDEHWAIRLWHVQNWIRTVSNYISGDYLEKATPSLWAADDPSGVVGSASGNGNLTNLVEHSSLSGKSSPRLFKTLRTLNDSLRTRARDALLTYLCNMSRVSISFSGTTSYVTKPSDLSDLLLQDVEASIVEKSSRIDEGILSVQNFVQRAQIGLEPSFAITREFSKQWNDRFSSFDKWIAWKRRTIYAENWVQWEELQKLYSFEGPKFLTEELKQLTSTITEPGRPMWWAGSNFPHESVIESIQVRDIASYGLEQGSKSTFEGLSLIGTPQRDARPSLLAAGLVFQSASTASNTSKVATPAATSAVVTKTATISKFVDSTGIGTLEAIPLWVEAAIRLGTKFVRVAAAGVPPAFSYGKSGKSEGPVCCAECGLLHDDLVDEYYFWLQDSTYFDYNDAPQNADVGATSAIDPTTDWETVNVATALPTLIYWPPKPLVHLSWARVHMGRLDPPRRSSEGIEYDPTASTPLLTFTGRQIDSLNFTALTAVTSLTPGTGTGSGSTFVQTYTGFRYDLATDSAIITPQLVGDAVPKPSDVGVPNPLASFPTFAYFQPGKPLVPVSSYGLALAMASASRSNCQFESALKWCQLIFDPLSMDNTWPQCPRKVGNGNETNTAKIVNSVAITSSAGPVNIGAVQTSASAKAVETINSLSPPSARPTVIRLDSTTTVDSRAALTPATTPGDPESGKQLQIEGFGGRDLPCCPSTPVNDQIARGRAVLLEFLKTLLNWGDRLLHRQSMEASHQALIIFNTMDRLLGSRPLTVNAHNKGTSSMTVASFVASPAPLNPKLLELYDAVADRQAMIRESENNRRLSDELSQIKLRVQNDGYLWDAPIVTPRCEVGDCFSHCQPYRFAAILPKAIELATMVKGLGASLLSAYEKGDTEYLASIRSAQDRKVLDLGLRSAQNAWRASDWDVQALDESMQSALTRLRYYQGLINSGLNSSESGYMFAQENAMQSQNASNVAEGTAQAANIIPDLAFGVAGLGPYESTTIPIGQKLANAASSAARIMSMIAQISSSNGSLQLTQAGWTRRAQDWQNQANVIQFEIQQIKRQTLAAWRRRDSALHDLNRHQQQIDHAAEVQDFMRDKLTKHELYLFLQQETAALYRQSYTLAMQLATDAQRAFKFERGDIEQNFLTNLEWNNLHEGLMAGDQLEISLRSMDRAYMEANCREYEITKNLSTKLQFPEAFLKLKSCGRCEVDIPEWMFDLDYPGHYMRRIKSVTLSIACVAGPYTSINCRLQLLNSAIRIKPLLPAEKECCCKDKRDPCNENDPYVARHFVASEAIATSDGQGDSGLFQLDFKDERYLPFEFCGAVSRWRIEIPPENNQFDITSLADVVMHLKYTSREGGHRLRERANECAQRHLPGDGLRLFDIRHEFPDTWRIFQMDHCKGKDKHRDWPLRFSRSMFPFLLGRRAVRIMRLHLVLALASHACRDMHIRVGVLPVERRSCKAEHFVCVANDDCASTYYGRVEVDFGPIGQSSWHDFGHLQFGGELAGVEQAYLLCEYEVDEADQVKQPGNTYFSA